MPYCYVASPREEHLHFFIVLLKYKHLKISVHLTSSFLDGYEP